MLNFTLATTVLVSQKSLRCGSPALPRNAVSVDRTRSFSMGETVTLSCQPGFASKTASHCVCEASGRWNEACSNSLVCESVGAA